MHLSPVNELGIRSHEAPARRRLRLVGRDEHMLHLANAARPRAIRVAIASGPPLMRAGFRALLEAEDDVAVAGEAASGEEAVELARRSRPDVILLDLDLPGIGALEATRRIAAEPRLPKVQVMVLTTSGSADRAIAALRAGASGVLVEDAEPAELTRAVRVLARGDALLSPRVARTLIAELTGRGDPALSIPDQCEEPS
jgi:DNA-binding NarL/FixJ family response regulator